MVPVRVKGDLSVQVAKTYVKVSQIIRLPYDSRGDATPLEVQVIVGSKFWRQSSERVVASA